MEITTRELRAGFPLELLYADDCILMAARKSLREKRVQWKSRLETTGLKMNTEIGR